MSEPQSPVPNDAPLMVAWEAYKATEAFTNSRTWAGIPAHTEGSLWAAFVEGWKAAGGSIWRSAGPSAVSPSADLGAIIVRLRRTFGIQREDKQAEMDSIIADLQAVSGVRVEDLATIEQALTSTRRGFQYRRFVKGEANYRTAKDDLAAVLIEIKTMRAARQRVRDSFGHRNDDGKCQCVYCRGDADGLAEHAADYEMRWASEKARADALQIELARLRGPAAGSEAPQEAWQPIETAPKDATWVLALLSDGDIRRIHFAEDVSGGDQPPFSGWFVKAGNSFYECSPTPTHWQPLPSPPARRRGAPPAP